MHTDSCTSTSALEALHIVRDSSRWVHRASKILRDCLACDVDAAKGQVAWLVHTSKENQREQEGTQGS